MAVEHRDVTASGVRVRVVESGSGPSVILLHGLFLDHSTWGPVREALAPAHRVVTPDLPGFCASEKPHPSRFSYRIEAFVEAIADLYAALELGRANVVGQCLGGAVALALAARHPELVSKLVLIDALCEAPHLGVYGRLGLTPVVGGFVLKQLWGRGVFGAFFRERLLSSRAEIDPARVDAYYEAFTEPLARGSALEALRAAADDPRPLAAKTLGVRAPTLVVWGSADRVVPVRLGRRLAREIPNAGLELLEAGHAPQEERPEQLSETLVRFLRE
ncbi:MAG TPA: alpha/beta hydrolase [Polyangiaceae bacterium]